MVRSRHVWQYVIASLLGFALLTTVGILLVQSIGNVEKLPIIGDNAGTTATKSPAAAKVDETATVVILNGGDTPNLAAALGDIVTQEQWGQVVFQGSTETPDVKISAVFYRDAADESAAAGLAAKLGGLSAYATEDYEEYDARLIVLIGADYAGPGIEEAKKMETTKEDPQEETPQSDNPAVDPATGYAIDPATGWLIDPATGWLIDPATGLPVDPSAG
jgi:hypothetical protein